MVFYTANLNFSDEDVAHRRHFRDSSAMNLRIIDNWNSVVTPDDKVYILGGLGEFEFLSSLNGEITLFFTDSEKPFYDKYIDSVTTEKEDQYNQELFDVYVKNMFCIDKVLFQKSIIKKDYSGTLLRLAVGVDSIRHSEQYVVAGGIGSFQRMFSNGINADIYVNGFYPLSEIDVQDSINHSKNLLL